MLQIKVKYLADIDPISETKRGEFVIGDMIDLRCAEDIEMKQGESRIIPLGIAMQLPEGYEAHLYPRSSTFNKYKILLVNSVGIIDNSYCGDNDEWKFMAYATEDTKIEKNTRICQFRIVEKQPSFEIVAVDHLGNPDRGGIGSTGEK